ncbi:MAG: sigma-70 family RNA polymerase sigma factor [Blastocatellia bacterium]|nr:sigma-70 family RNA polymerase sigma factor [Blastocatellia bacterium]
MGKTDSLLRIFVHTADAAEQESVLSELLTEHAEPVITKIIRYKTRHADDGEEICSEVMLQLIGRLQKLRTETNGKLIENFNSYAAVTTYNACDRFFSRNYPNRREQNGHR